MNIILIGFMGTGKSTVGRLLAERLGWSFYDTDSMIEKETGFSIAQIFAKRGEDAFRELESQTIRLVSVLDRGVIATGGGAPLKPENMRELQNNGFLVALAARPDTILERLGPTLSSRPKLAGQDPRGVVASLLREREKFYAAAKTQVPTDGLSPEAVVEKILAILPADAKKKS